MGLYFSTDLVYAMSFSGLAGLAQISDHLFISSAKSASNSALLSHFQISCIINATEDSQEPCIPSVEYVHVSVSDAPETRLEQYFDAVADKIDEVRRRQGRALVHCRAGVSRSAALCLAYLVKYGAKSLLEAHRLLRAHRPIIRPNAGFWKQLVEYELRVRGSNSVTMITSPLGLIPDLYENETRHFVAL